MFTHMRLIGRKDRGIHRVSDFTGKRIGVPVNTAADFELGRFFDLHAIDKGKVIIADVQAPQAVEALMEGAVDAVVAWQPNVMALQDRLGDAAAIFPVQSGQPVFCLLLAPGQWANRHPDLLQRFIRSLLQAEDYLIQNESAARAIVQQRLGYDDRFIRTIWPEHRFSLRLDQSLITAMEDQARWMIRSRLTGKTTCRI